MYTVAVFPNTESKQTHDEGAEVRDPIAGHKLLAFGLITVTRWTKKHHVWPFTV